MLSIDANHYFTADVSVHGAISRHHKIKWHKSPCIYYPNTVAAFNVELIGDLTFKLNPSPSVDGKIPVIIFAWTHCSCTTRPSIVPCNAYGITLGSNTKGINVQNLSYVKCMEEFKTHWWLCSDWFLPIEYQIYQ